MAQHHENELERTRAEGSRAPTDFSLSSQFDRTGAFQNTADDENKSDSPGAPSSGWPRVEGYEIIDVLGAGGMGVVYKARQLGLKRIVALKMILAGPHASATALARFQAEAQAAARLQHPGIVQVYEIGEWHCESSAMPLPYFSLEYVEGGSLAQFLNGNPQDPRLAAKCTASLADSMQFAHDHQIVHRDLKPGNILLSAESGSGNTESKSATPLVASSLRHPDSLFLSAKISDFGLAKQLDDMSGQTVSGAILGTPSYMAPEQAAGHAGEAGPAVDIYALGAILYEMLTGRPPFKGPTVLDTLDQVRKQEPVPPSRLQPRTPRDIETICLKCLQKEPGKRYVSAAELAADIRRYLNGEPILARQTGRIERFRRWCVRNPVIAGSAFLIALSLILGTVVSSIFAAKFYTERGLARESESRARDEARRKAQGLYVAEFRLAVQKFERGEIDEVLRILQRLAPREGEEDFRSFEWHYLRRQCETELRSYAGYSGGVLTVAISPNGRRLAAAGTDRIIRIWERSSGVVVAELRGHSGEIHCLAFSSDGRRLASASTDKTVKIWDPDKRVETATLSGHDDWVRTVVFLPGDDRLATGGNDETVRVWDLKSNRSRTLFSEAGVVFCLAVCPTSAWLAVGGSNSIVSLLDLTSGQIVRQLRGHSDTVEAVAFSPDGTRLASAGFDATIALWDTATGRQQATLAGHVGEVRSVAFSEDGTRLVSAGQDRIVRVWDLSRSRASLTLRGHTGPLSAVAFVGDGSQVVSGGADSAIRLWNVREAQGHEVLLGHSRFASGVDYSSDGRFLASSSRDQSGVIWDLVTGNPIRTLREHAAELVGISFHSTENAVVTAGVDGAIAVWDRDTWKIVRRFAEPTGTIQTMALSADGKWIAWSGRESTISIRSFDGRGDVRILRGHRSFVTRLAFSSDHRHLASTSFDGTTRVWNLETDEPCCELADQMSLRPYVAWSPDGQLVAAGGHISIWNWRECRIERTLGEGVVAPYCVLFSNDGRRVFSVGEDNVVRIRDLATGLELIALSGLARAGNSLALSNDGFRLACACDEGRVICWDARPLTEDLRVEREAVAAIRFHRDWYVPTSLLGRRIASDPTISDSVRRTALKLAMP